MNLCHVIDVGLVQVIAAAHQDDGVKLARLVLEEGVVKDAVGSVDGEPPPLKMLLVLT